jgi:hypothetical protein
MKDVMAGRTDFRSEQNLDSLLRTFYQGEMPHRWPEWKTPQQSVIVPARSHSWSGILRSRFALAASIALMILGFVFVSDKIQNGNPSDSSFDKIGIRPDPTSLKPQPAKPRMKESIRVNGESPSQYRIDFVDHP